MSASCGACLPDLEAKINKVVATGFQPSMASIVAGMGQGSLFNLACALEAVQRSGIGGMLTILIPSKTDSRVEVDWTPARTIRQVG